MWNDGPAIEATADVGDTSPHADFGRVQALQEYIEGSSYNGGLLSDQPVVEEVDDTVDTSDASDVGSAGGLKNVNSTRHSQFHTSRRADYSLLLQFKTAQTQLLICLAIRHWLKPGMQVASKNTLISLLPTPTEPTVKSRSH